MKYAGKVGYEIMVETSPGVWEPKIMERKYLGEVVQTAWHSQAAASTLNDNPSLNSQIEIVADAFAWAHYGSIVYAEWENSKWKVSSIQVRRPRLILNFSSIYKPSQQEDEDEEE